MLSNIYLNEIDKMLERAKETTNNGRYTRIEHARFADDLVILVDGCYQKCKWLVKAVTKVRVSRLQRYQTQISAPVLDPTDEGG